MKLAELLSELQVRGHWLELRGTGIRCHGRQPLARDLAAGIEQYKEELLRQLLEEQQTQAERADPFEGKVGHGATDPEHLGWIAIDGVLYSPAAADLYRRSVPFTGTAASDICRSCSGTRWWRLRAGYPWVCQRCHPTDRAERKVEWREGAGTCPRSDPPPSRPSAPAALTFNPEVPHE